MKAWDVVGYTFQADNHCVDCIDIDWHSTRASANVVDLMDERSFDSSDYPKVIFQSDTDGDICGTCGGEL